MQRSRDLLHSVLMPLHAPNEMVEWRDQVPVLQGYHESLVRCMVRLNEVCIQQLQQQARGSAGADAISSTSSSSTTAPSTAQFSATSTPTLTLTPSTPAPASAASSALLVETITAQLKSWPDSYQTNTPKQVGEIAATLPYNFTLHNMLGETSIDSYKQ
jgi:hypothetical protein